MQLLASAVAGLAFGFVARGWREELAESLMKASVVALVFIMGLEVSGYLFSSSATGILFMAVLVAVVPGMLGVGVARLLLARVEEATGQGSLGRGLQGLPLGGLVYLASMVAGAVVGRVYDASVPPVLVSLLLMVLVGLASYTIGGAVARSPGIIREGSRLGFVLALSAVVGSVVAGFLLSSILDVELGLVMVATLANGWYSLAGPLLLPYDPVVAAAALLGNMMREALHIVTYPVMSRFMPLSWIALGGATTMDTGLPVVAAYGGGRERVAAFVQGAILTLGLSLGLPALVGFLLG
ncbi:MAG: lysine exporter LysO family protein [Desulfurococcales archaeon]|nr:lysine exporter LysO family protein [Desulfurococcales archaeon]